MRRQPDESPEAAAALWAAAMRGDDTVDPVREEQALAAFRAARDAGGHAHAHGVRRARRRDDWRPGGAELRRRRSLRAAAMGLAATVLLGGVAVAAQTGAIPTPFGGGGDGDGGRGGSVPRPSTAPTAPPDVPASPVTEQESGRSAASPTPSARTPEAPSPGRTVTDAEGEERPATGGDERKAGPPKSGTGAGAGTGSEANPAKGAASGGGGTGGETGGDSGGEGRGGGKPAGGGKRP
ncbi:hypothetical protein ACIRNI_09325 [Streptomyces sp. NPDC093546]|uniref:hypothetical protein n=1 Tax=Streptomyces sp. NPDC093546 TaxID=3366040 RepID=UPI00380CE5D0